MVSIKKILFNPWVVGIGSTLLGACILKVFDILVGTDIFSQILNSVFQGIDFIYSLFSHKISLGWIVIVFFIGSILSMLYKKWFYFNTVRNRPKYLDYTEDVLQGVLYRWKYVCVNGKHKIGETAAYCPACKHRIVHDECLSCKSSFLTDKKDRQQREAMIRHAIEVKYQVNEFNELGK